MSAFLDHYETDRARLDTFIVQTDTNLTALQRGQAKTRENVAALNNNLGDHINSSRNDTSGGLDTFDARLTNMEEHGLATNRTLSMLETRITQNNQEIVIIRQHLADVDKSLLSVHKTV